MESDFTGLKRFVKALNGEAILDKETGKAWIVNFESGDVHAYGKYDSKIACRVWCVRGGQGNKGC